MARTPIIIVCLILGVLAACSGESITSPPAPDAPAPSDTLDVALDAVDPDVPALDRTLPDDVGLDVPADQVVPLDAPADVNTLDATDVTDTGCAMGSTRCGDTCVDLATSVTNCGACGTNCRALPGVDVDRVSCVRGACVFDGVCLAGRGDCDGMLATGCEADLSTATNCGRCGIACSGSTPICAMMPGDGGGVRTCTSGCTAMTPTRCGMACVDTASDLMHCGGCGQTCVAPAGGRASCALGVCTLSCSTGMHQCDGRCVANDDPNTCGSRCTPCPSGPVGSSPVCTSGACDFVCGTGLHRCGTSCISTMSTSGCGTSCSPCPTAANADPTCDGMRCGFRCRDGFADCDRDPSNGCEASLVSPATCNRCDNRCMPPVNATATCDGTSCGFTCNTGFHRCGASCLSNMSPAACGSSCSPCSAPDHATGTCDGTRCDFVCDAGFTRCGSICLDTRGDVNNCGTCGRRCGSANTTAICSGGTCSHGACYTGYDDCNSDPADGCETNLWSNATCGACGRACGSGYSCLRGTCVANGSVCGRAYFTVDCPFTFYVCTQHSTCPSGSGGICTCDFGYRSITCAGTPCSGRECPGPDFWCQPVP